MLEHLVRVSQNGKPDCAFAHSERREGKRLYFDSLVQLVLRPTLRDLTEEELELQDSKTFKPITYSWLVYCQLRGDCKTNTYLYGNPHLQKGFY